MRWVAMLNAEVRRLGEELGLTGLLAILALYLIIAQRGLRTGVASDERGPSCGKHALARPHAVIEVQQAEPGEIANST